MTKNKKIILGSGSPRRKEILQQAGLEFEIIKSDVDEVYPSTLDADKIPEYLAKLKADVLKTGLQDDAVLLTADTLVFCDGEILAKPKDRDEAILFLQKLSGKSHEVIGGYCLTSKTKQVCFSDTTKVYFKKLSTKEIEHYVDQYQPYDKAGAYAIQEWIGLIGIEKIDGSYFNVVGLAMHKVYKNLEEF